MKPYDFEVVIMSCGERGEPHRAALVASNPGLIVHAVNTAAETGLDGWRNCDRNIRNWWRDHRQDVQSRRVLFLEYDVLVRMDLRDIFPASPAWSGLEGKSMPTIIHDGRSFWPFQDARKLPVQMRAMVCAIAPLAVCMAGVDLLDAIIGSEWDPLFAADIFSEVRLATLARFLGYPVRGNSGLTDVECTPLAYPGPGVRGVFHPVKNGGGE